MNPSWAQYFILGYIIIYYVMHGVLWPMFGTISSLRGYHFRKNVRNCLNLKASTDYLLFSCLLAVRCVWQCSDLQTSVTQPRTFATRRSVCDFLCWWFTTFCCCERL